jgi:hypothetical protein
MVITKPNQEAFKVIYSMVVLVVLARAQEAGGAGNLLTTSLKE